MDAIDFILLEHARAHTSALLAADPDALTPHLPAGPTPRHAWDRQGDMLLAGFTEEQLRCCPEGMNSLAWIIWHIARAEDFKIALLTDEPQVFEDGWQVPLGAERRDAGTAMPPEQVAALSTQIDLDALREYWVTVGRRTRVAIEAWRGTALDRVYDEEALLERMRSEEMMTAPVVAWERDHAFLRGRTTAWFLSQLTCHTSIHIGEGFVTAERVRALTAQAPIADEPMSTPRRP